MSLQSQLSQLAARIAEQFGETRPVFEVPANLIPVQCDEITVETLPLVSLTQEEIVLIAGVSPVA